MSLSDKLNLAISLSDKLLLNFSLPMYCFFF